MKIVNRRKLTNSNGQKLFTLYDKEITAKQIQTKSRYYITQAGLNTKLNFHSLRHTFASWLVQRGVSIYEVSKLLGHSDLKMTQIYSHLRTEDLLISVEKLNQELSNG
jgi:site-specific recombinase XerD